MKALIIAFALTAATASAQTKTAPIAWPPAEASTGIREVSASERSLITLNTRIRFSSMIILPEGEDIVDIVCGDKDFWVITATHNIAHVKPAKEGAATNLNLVAASGAIYSFLLNEGKSATPDLKVYIQGEAIKPATKKYFTAEEMERRDQAVQDALNQVDAAQQKADVGMAEFKAAYPASMQPYPNVPYAKPFLLRGIWHDDRFTYVKTDARELPAIYEMKDGKPSLVNFQVQRQGVYIVPKILESGYFMLGKERQAFRLMPQGN